jgi:hypothetical protein
MEIDAILRRSGIWVSTEASPGLTSIRHQRTAPELGQTKSTVLFRPRLSKLALPRRSQRFVSRPRSRHRRPRPRCRRRPGSRCWAAATTTPCRRLRSAPRVNRSGMAGTTGPPLLFTLQAKRYTRAAHMSIGLFIPTLALSKVSPLGSSRSPCTNQPATPWTGWRESWSVLTQLTTRAWRHLSLSPPARGQPTKPRLRTLTPSIERPLGWQPRSSPESRYQLSFAFLSLVSLNSTDILRGVRPGIHDLLHCGRLAYWHFPQTIPVILTTIYTRCITRLWGYTPARSLHLSLALIPYGLSTSTTRYPLLAVSWRLLLFFLFFTFVVGWVFGYSRAMVSFGKATTTRYDSFLVLGRRTGHDGGM